MSVPRKIWVDYERDMFSFSEDAPTSSCPASVTAYHHDDVVRELVEAGTALVNRWDSPLWAGAADNLRHTGEYIAVLRAALAKIAQDA